MAFTHLHLHTEFSLLDGACKIQSLVQKLKEIGQHACAVTDHGAMYGAVDFYNACKKEGIKPIIGTECYICEDRTNKTQADREYNHLILLCKNEKGYQNLCKLVSAGFTEGYYYKPRIDYKLLAQHTEGLICLSACIFGKLPQLLLKNQVEEAKKHALYMQSLFGAGNYYIEIMNHGLNDELFVLPKLVQLAKETGIPLVATNDCHYIEKEQAKAQEVLMCIKTGKLLDDSDRMRMLTDQLYVKTEEEMQALFAQYPNAIENTERIAEQCNFEFDFKTMHLPAYPLETDVQAVDYLRQLCLQGLQQRYPNKCEPGSAPYIRMAYEIDMIAKMGYVDYFLIVWDFIRYAKNKGIPVGPGRGSGAGSIVAYTLDITGLDPLKYNLIFERFLNPERLSMPDLDIDFCYERRQEVIDYVTNKYGADKVAQIITFGTMAARGVIRDVGRVLGVPLAKVDKLAKMVPTQLGITLKSAFQLNPDLETEYQTDEESRKLFDMAKLLEGMPRNASTHAAGVLISSKPVTDIVPIQKNDEVVTTQYTMTTLEQLGLLKMDFLGLRTLTVIRDTLSLINDTNLQSEENIPLNDSKVYKMISNGDTLGVFQLESGGMRVFLHNLKPECFEDIIAAISLYRPGPMDSIPKYIQGKHNADSIQYITPELKPILDVTYGCIVYQEQVMQIVRDLAGYSLGRSDLVRRAMAKKKHDVMEKERNYFVHGIQNEDGSYLVDGCVRRGIKESIANKIFDDMSSFASYAFNKSHAAAYGVLSVRTAYLKCYYPVEFMAATLNSFLDSTSKIALYVQYCRSADIKILPPNINHSVWKFSVETHNNQKCIRFGLGAIKNIGIAAVQSIIAERLQRPFKDLLDFIDRIPEKSVNKRMIECFIKAGAFDGLQYNRTQMLNIYESELEKKQSRSKNNVRGQMSLFDVFQSTEAQTEVLPMQEYPLRTLLAMEKEITGIYISGHPLDAYIQQLQAYDSIVDILEYAQQEDKGIAVDGKRVHLAGILVGVKKRATKKGELMATIALEDLGAQIEGLVFPKALQRMSNVLEVDRLVEIYAKISVKEDEDIKIIVDDVKELLLNENRQIIKEEALASKKDEKLYLRIQSSQLEHLKKILLRHAGNSPVYVKLIDTNKAILFDKELWCNLTEDLIDECIENFGMDNIIIQ